MLYIYASPFIVLFTECSSLKTDHPAEQPPDWLVYYDVIFDPGEKSRVRLCRKWQQNEAGARRLNVNISGMDEWYVLKFGR